MKIVKKAFLGLVFSTLALNPLVNSYAEPKVMPPTMPDLSEDSNLSSDLSQWRTELQAFFDSQGSDYAVSYGIGNLDVTDKSSSRYIGSVTAAYKQALVSAYVELSKQINPNGFDVTTSDNLGNKSASGDLLDDRVKAACRLEGQAAYKKHLAELARKKEEQESILGKLEAQFLGDGSDVTPVTDVPEKTEDFIHHCTAEGASFSQSSVSTQQLADVLSGGRIWATVLHKDKLGLILMRSSETSEIASVLKNQMMPSTVNRSALVELNERIKQELANFQGIPTGIVGTRMLRLSNREWAVYAYGAAQTKGNAAGGFMDSVMESEDMKNAQQEAIAELSRFSSLNIDFERIMNDVREVKSRYKIEYNVTQDKLKLKIDEEQTFGKIIDAAYSATSSLTLKGSEQIFTKNIKDGPLSYYLAVHAWSPSIMAKNIDKRTQQDVAAENAARNGKYQVDQPVSSSQGNGSGKSKVIIFNQDW